MLNSALSLSLFFITALTALAQSEVRTYYDSAWQLTTKANGLYYRSGTIDPNNYQFEGEVRDYFISGAIEMKGTYRAGVMVDTFFFYYPGGQLKAKGLYKDSKRSGTWTYYHENGRISNKVYFIEGVFIYAMECYDEFGNALMVNGTGIWNTSYYDDLLGDSVIILGKYRDYQRHGVWKAYRVYQVYPNSVKGVGRKLHGVEEYLDGKFVNGKFYGGHEVGRDIGNPTFSILTETEKFKKIENWDVSYKHSPTIADYPFLGFLPRPLSFIDLPYDYPEPTNDEIAELLMKVDSLFYSTSGRLVLDLKNVPESVTNRIQFIRDSVNEYHYASLNKGQRKLALSFGRGPTRGAFFANKGESWRGTDVVYPGTETLPTRQFLFSIIDGDEVIFAYWHGGIAIHIHMYYVRLNDFGTFSGFVTNSNADTFRKFDRKGRWDKFKSTKWEPLIGNGLLRVFKGKVAYPPLDET